MDIDKGKPSGFQSQILIHLRELQAENFMQLAEVAMDQSYIAKSRETLKELMSSMTRQFGNKEIP